MKTKLLLAALLLLAIALTPRDAVVATQAAAATHHVRPVATGSADCSSWDHACTLQTALSAAGTDDEIWVAAGIYTPTVPAGRGATFQLNPGVAIYGGFAATETVRSQRDWQANVTVLSGDLDGNDLTDAHGIVTTTAHISGSNTYHVVSADGITEIAVIDGLTITAGDAVSRLGGGMYSISSSPTLANLTFSGNAAYAAGGGLYNESGNPTLTNVTFRGNECQSGGGGGMNTYQGSPQLTDVVFVDNTADRGGGMYNEDNCNPQLTHVTFISNTAWSNGGGMYNYMGSYATLTDVTFISNTATMGGGMYNTESGALLVSVTISGNTASQYGGGINNHQGSSPTLIDVIFRGNTASRGGGMYNWGSSNPFLANVFFAGNSATRGGAMYNDGYCQPALVNVTIAVNTASDNGGGILSTGISTPTLANCILWGNTPQQIDDVSASLTGVTTSDVQGGWSGSGNIDADPLFVREPHPGLDSTWGTLDDDYGDLHLQGNSPAIDAGSNGALPADVADRDGDLDTGEPLPFDIDGDLRIRSGTVDMGAYEATPYVYLPLVFKSY